MSRDTLLGGILKIAGAGALLYGAYKLGEIHANRQIKESVTEPIVPLVETKEEVKEKTEEETIIELIEELRNKPNKNRNDKFNIDLLEVKLKQIRKQK
jgi:hypothetical protein